VLASTLVLAGVCFIGVLLVLHTTALSKESSASMLGFYANLLADVRRNRIAQTQAEIDGVIETARPHNDAHHDEAQAAHEPHAAE